MIGAKRVVLRNGLARARHKAAESEALRARRLNTADASSSGEQSASGIRVQGRLGPQSIADLGSRAACARRFARQKWESRARPCLSARLIRPGVNLASTPADLIRAIGTRSPSVLRAGCQKRLGAAGSFRALVDCVGQQRHHPRHFEHGMAAWAASGIEKALPYHPVRAFPCGHVAWR